MREKLLGERAITWIETYCRWPDGALKGQPVKVSLEGRDLLRRIYDDGEPVAEPIAGPLGAYLVLYHLCGHAAAQRLKSPPTNTNIWTVWGIVEQSPELKAVLRRDGTKISCSELMTGWAA